MRKATILELNPVEVESRLEMQNLSLVLFRTPLSESLITFSNPRDSMRQWVETTYTLTHNDTTLNNPIASYSVIWEHLSVIALKQT